MYNAYEVCVLAFTSMFQFAKIAKLNTRIAAVVLLVVVVGIIASLTWAGHRDSGSTSTVEKADGSTHSLVGMAVGASEAAAHVVRLGELSPSGLAAGPTTRSTASASQPKEVSDVNVRQTVTLWNAAGSEFESNLLEAVGGRMATRRRGDGKSEYLLSFGGGQSPLLQIDTATNKVVIEGRRGPVRGAVQLVHALDKARASDGVSIRCVSTPRFRGKDIKRLIQAVSMDSKSRARGSYKDLSSRHPQPMAVAFQYGSGGNAKAKPPREGAKTKDSDKQDPKQTSPSGRLQAPVQVQALEGLDAVIIRGHPKDVKRVTELIKQLEEYSKTAKLATDIVLLKHVDATALGILLRTLHEEMFLDREGAMSITPLAAPNALLLTGSPQSVEKLKGLVKQLDRPLSPTASFKVFRLKSVAAIKAQEDITAFFEQEGLDETALVPRVHIVAAFRSNSLIVRASPNDMAEVAAIIARIDSSDSDAFNEVRVFKLKNASSETLAPIIQDALTGQMYGQRSRRGPGGMGGMGGGIGGQDKGYEVKSTRLKLVTIDAKGRTVLNSGILADAQVTADPRTNGLIVTASADSMPLIAALIRELDNPPSVEAQVKVFTLVNGDATNTAKMLEQIFGKEVAGDEIAVQTGIVPDETSLVGLNFAVDVRTNSIIVTGSAGALIVVEAVLTNLDGSDPRERKTMVYRIKNIEAEAVAIAINEYLTTKRDIETAQPDVLSVFEQIEREVIVVPEKASNSIIISATPRYFDDIIKLINDLDRQQPMIMIQVVIAEIALDNFDEFGVEIGLEDSLLFDRRLALGGLAIPGALFSNTQNNDPGGRALTSLGTGQINADLQYGGLVINASSESVSALIRALSTCRRIKVLSRPQIMTMDNEEAQIVVGEDVPFIDTSSFTTFGQANNIKYREVGLILTVTPRVSAEGFVVMEIVATNSKVGPIDEGIPVSVSGGEVIKSPRIEMISAQTVLSAMSGQTVVMGGLIIEDDRLIVRRVPVLSSIPVLGCLFKYESTVHDRKELLIIMTPRIVKNADDAHRIAQIEASRLHWCRSDVQKMHGGYGGDRFFASPCVVDGPQVIYPDETPTLELMPEMMPGMTHDSDGTEGISTLRGAAMMPSTLEHELIPQPEPELRPSPSRPMVPRLKQPNGVSPDFSSPQTRDPVNPMTSGTSQAVVPVQWTTTQQPVYPVTPAQGNR